jgi:hypothetical protein
MRRRLAALILFIAAACTRAAETVAESAKDPFAYPVKWYGLVLGISVLGGFVTWVRKVRRGQLVGAHIRELIGDLTTSAFAGLLTFWFCESMNVSPIITASMTGIAGHMGSRAIDVLETIMLRKVGFTPDRRVNSASKPMPLDDGR